MKVYFMSIIYERAKTSYKWSGIIQIQANGCGVFDYYDEIKQEAVKAANEKLDIHTEVNEWHVETFNQV